MLRKLLAAAVSACPLVLAACSSAPSPDEMRRKLCDFQSRGSHTIESHVSIGSNAVINGPVNNVVTVDGKRPLWAAVLYGPDQTSVGGTNVTPVGQQCGMTPYGYRCQPVGVARPWRKSTNSIYGLARVPIDGSTPDAQNAAMRRADSMARNNCRTAADKFEDATGADIECVRIDQQICQS